MKQVDAQRGASLANLNLVRAKLLFVPACTLCLNEFQSRRVHAITEVGRGWAVVQNVPKVGIAPPAQDLGRVFAPCQPPCRWHNAKRKIIFRADVFVRNRRPEARPSGSRFVLRIGTEKRIVATEAAVDAFFVVVPILACESALRSLLSSDLELLGS